MEALASVVADLFRLTHESASSDPTGTNRDQPAEWASNARQLAGKPGNDKDQIATWWHLKQGFPDTGTNFGAWWTRKCDYDPPSSNDPCEATWGDAEFRRRNLQEDKINRMGMTRGGMLGKIEEWAQGVQKGPFFIKLAETPSWAGAGPGIEVHDRQANDIYHVGIMWIQSSAVFPPWADGRIVYTKKSDFELGITPILPPRLGPSALFRDVCTYRGYTRLPRSSTWAAARRSSTFRSQALLRPFANAPIATKQVGAACRIAD